MKLFFKKILNVIIWWLPDEVINLIGKIQTIHISETGKVLNMWEHKGWGNTIYFRDWEKREIAGWYSYLKMGDEIRCKMQTGKIGRFLVTELKYYHNPKDMFYGKVKDKGYL